MYSPFSHYIRDHWTKGSAIFELKICKGQRLLLSCLKDHQERSLKMATTSAIYHKISDQSQGTKPFDSFYLQKIQSYVVLVFYSKGQYPVYFIDIMDWIKFKNTGAKSITENEAREISTVIGHI